MRNIFLKFSLLLSITISAFTVQSNAQYANEWINYTSTYYKFKIGKDGIYRIPQSTLASAGLSGYTGTQLTIYRNGVKIPIYVSNNGSFSGTDYIEFFGQKSDGTFDKQLYSNANWHPTERYSMFTDTAAYYLTVASGSHPRINNNSFTLPSSLPSPEPYMMTEAISNNGYKPSTFYIGESYVTDRTLLKSSFDKGEGWLTNPINLNITSTTPTTTNNNITLNKLYTASAVGSSIYVAYTNGRILTATPKLAVNSTMLKDTTLFGYLTLKRKFDVSSTVLTSTTNVKSTDIRSAGFNIIIIEYPRTFSYSGLTSNYTQFKLAASTYSKYLNFTDIASIGDQSVLYDLTNNRRYQGVNGSTNAQYYIPASTTSLDFAFQTGSEIANIGALETVNFKNYNNIANQGNYIILSHKGHILHSTNPVGDYATYRQSAQGGGHNVTVVDVTELYDQFGYGNDYHPMAIKNFLKYAYDNWGTNKPEHVFIVGKGLLYNLYKTYQANPSSYEFGNLVPTYGNPGSDNLFADFNNDNVPEIAIGRLSAWNATQISNYLEKVKTYETELNNPAIPNLENTLWKKSALHVAGGSLAEQNAFINPAFNKCTNIYSDSLMGGIVTNIRKSTTGLVPEETDDQKIKNKLLEGINRFTFYGHAFSTGFDYNLNHPEELISSPRFPNFLAMGCNVSQIFINDNTIGEDFINSANGGSISMIASNSLGYSSILDYYIENFYKNISYLNYGKTVGIQYIKNLENMPAAATTSGLGITHIQNIIYQGDPGLMTYAPEKTDFYTDNSLIKSSVNPLHTGIDSAIISTVVYNLGHTTNDKVKITIEHHKPNGTIVYHSDTISKKINTFDTLHFKVGFDNMADIGMNKIIVRVNPTMEISEISYTQNVAEINLFMSSDVIIPIYPSEFAIVHDEPLVLKASALNLLKPNQNYIIQIDTTEKFNSSFKKEQKFTNLLGGTVSWNPPITMVDSQVYYWRTTTGSMVTDTSLWYNSSFIYLKDGFDGWNQSHYYQYTKNQPYVNLQLEDTQRNFKYGLIEHDVVVYNRIYSAENPNVLDVRTLINNEEVDKMGCTTAGSIKFIVINPHDAQPLYNPGSKYNSVARCIAPGLNRNSKQFEFQTNTKVWRKRAADFIDSIPEGHYVVVTNLIWTADGVSYSANNLAINWGVDDADYGETNTLKYKLKELGFDQIDSFNRRRVFTFVTKKNDASFENITKFSDELEEMTTVQFSVFTRAQYGTMQSTKIGPASKWQAALWKFEHPFGNPENDINTLKIFGINNSSERNLLHTITSGISFDLSSIDATNYPFIDLEWHSKDDSNKTSANLDYWRVLYTPIPEGGLSPNRHISYAADTIQEGQKVTFEIGFDNLTNIPFGDSILVSYNITKADGTSELLKTEKIKRLVGFDSTVAKLEFDARHFPGKNTIFVEVNPDNNQPEQYHPNNIGHFTFYMQKDSTNPVLDVTFDGVHILDRDIVSAKPLIKIMLKDENLNIPLADTSLMKLQLLRPGSTTPEDIIIDGNIAKFIPSTSDTKNEASIDFTPTFTKDGLYKLIVVGKDNTGNTAGSSPKYEIQFMVETKPSITNLLNYPNPFSTSTAFVFTLTGSQIPEQFKIQILTVTGKIVKEITKQELGTIRIGRNITDYKWDGRDQYGQLLGNGVYIYRLVTRLNGTTVEHRENKEIDQYFNKDGYGKMYIMR